ncbi:MAG: hypothetical protein DRQ51_05595 [Gammaproteobacteria bacterium]|nr:MAG: hypothetical protein DRQ51_05595 [Gammaproteobacteria bacterium]
MKKIFVSIFAIMFVLISSVDLMAQEPNKQQRPPPLPRDPIAEFDKNGDGALSSNEFAVIVQKRYEMQEKMHQDWLKNRPKSEEIFKKIDANSDGKLSKEELFQNRPRHPRGKNRKNNGGQRGGMRPPVRQ